MPYTIGGIIVFDEKTNTVSDLGQTKFVALNLNAARCLVLLIGRPYEEISRREIMQIIWRERGMIVVENSLTQVILSLRRAFAGVSLGAEKLIVTIPRFGYKLEAAVSQLSPATAAPGLQEPVAAVSQAGVDTALPWQTKPALNQTIVMPVEPAAAVAAAAAIETRKWKARLLAGEHLLVLVLAVAVVSFMLAKLTVVRNACGG